jgi:hypothetical protein
MKFAPPYCRYSADILVLTKGFVKVGLNVMRKIKFSDINENRNMVFLPLSSHGLQTFIKTGNVLTS